MRSKAQKRLKREVAFRNSCALLRWRSRAHKRWPDVGVVFFNKPDISIYQLSKQYTQIHALLRWKQGT